MQARYRTGTHSAPAVKEGRKIDILSRKVYASSSLNLRIANYQAMMSACQLFLWEEIAPYLDQLPDEQKLLARVLQVEALKLSK